MLPAYKLGGGVPTLPTREQLIKVWRDEAQALLKQAYQLKNSKHTAAPDRIIGAANELIAALHIVGRPEAVNTIMNVIGSVKDWTAAHEHELKKERRQKDWTAAREHELKKKRESERRQSAPACLDNTDLIGGELDDSYLEDQEMVEEMVEALCDAERNAGLVQPTPPITPPEDLDDGAPPPCYHCYHC